MDISAIFAGIASLTAIIGLIYSVRQHRDNIRKEFILWALQQMQSSEQRESRGAIYFLDRPENLKKKQKLIDGIVSGDEKTLYGEEYSKLRAMLALFNEIGYFWSKVGYGNTQDIKALFPQLPELWIISLPYISAIRERPGQEKSYLFYEQLVIKIVGSKNLSRGAIPSSA